MTPYVCLIEDDPIMGESLTVRFELEGLRADWHRDATAALASIGSVPYTVVLSDIKLPDLAGDELFHRVVDRLPVPPPFIFITAFGSISRAVELLKAGAADYISKPFDIDDLLAKIRAYSLLAVPSTHFANATPVLGVSVPMVRIAGLLPKLAHHRDTVLLTGESGVGKEHVAMALHTLGGDPSRPFVAVNCGAVTETLLEAELFGHEKGAFTGANRTARGYFEQAHGGTLFLDEIGETSPGMQVKLLRALQDRRIRRVGSETEQAVDVRLICATNKDLKRAVEDGKFREDLFYRINVIPLRVPSLRERQEDIAWLAQRFLDGWAREHEAVPRRLSEGAMTWATTYGWPGNVRELKHRIERACLLSAGPRIEAEQLADDWLEATAPAERPATERLGDYLLDREREFIVQALMSRDWQVANTASSLGISRKSLWERMRRLGISRP